jgi:AraC-like DNA-binding protein
MIVTSMPAFPYQFAELHRVCCRVSMQVPPFALGGRQVATDLVHVREFRAQTTTTMVTASYEVNLCLSGHGIVTGTRELPVAPGSVVVFPPGVEWSWRSLDHPCLMLFMFFTVTPALRLPEPAHWPQWPWALHDLTVIMEESRWNAPGWVRRAGWRLAALVSRALTLASDVKPCDVPPSHFPDLLPTAVEQFLTAQLSTPITLADVAAAVQLSRRTLSRVYRQQTGTTVMARLLQLRLAFVAKCLLETSLPLADIAAQSGIHDKCYLCRVFRQQYAVSPMQYRKRHRPGSGA